jgi:hypothetical protein
MIRLKSSGISSSNTPDGDVVVSGVPLETLLAALGFDKPPYKVQNQGRSIAIVEVLDT